MNNAEPTLDEVLELVMDAPICGGASLRALFRRRLYGGRKGRSAARRLKLLGPVLEAVRADYAAMRAAAAAAAAAP
jgi:hypothetical protein